MPLEQLRCKKRSCKPSGGIRETDVYYTTCTWVAGNPQRLPCAQRGRLRVPPNWTLKNRSSTCKNWGDGLPLGCVHDDSARVRARVSVSIRV